MNLLDNPYAIRSGLAATGADALPKRPIQGRIPAK